LDGIVNDCVVSQMSTVDHSLSILVRPPDELFPSNGSLGSSLCSISSSAEAAVLPEMRPFYRSNPAFKLAIPKPRRMKLPGTNSKEILKPAAESQPTANEMAVVTSL
jgi:hypothetical protein